MLSRPHSPRPSSSTFAGHVSSRVVSTLDITRRRRARRSATELVWVDLAETSPALPDTLQILAISNYAEASAWVDIMVFDTWNNTPAGEASIRADIPVFEIWNNGPSTLMPFALDKVVACTDFSTVEFLELFPRAQSRDDAALRRSAIPICARWRGSCGDVSVLLTA